MKTFFQFAFRCSDGSTRFILAEAENEEQDECLKESVVEGMLNERCMLLAVFHDCSEVTLANDAFRQVGFAEFMMDLGGFDDMPKALQKRVEKAAEMGPKATETAPKVLVAGQTDKLVSALTGLGFGASSVKKWVKSLGPKAENLSLETLVKDGVKALVNADAA